MSRLEEIKNEIAVKAEFEDWKDLRSFHIYEDISDGLQEFEKEVAVRYAKECSQASLEKASEKAVAYKLAYPNNRSKAIVEKESITNPENIVLL